MERPAYEPLTAVPRALGAAVRRFERRFEDGYRLDVSGAWDLARRRRSWRRVWGISGGP